MISCAIAAAPALMSSIYSGFARSQISVTLQLASSLRATTSETCEPSVTRKGALTLPSSSQMTQHGMGRISPLVRFAMSSSIAWACDRGSRLSRLRPMTSASASGSSRAWLIRKRSSSKYALVRTPRAFKDVAIARSCVRVTVPCPISRTCMLPLLNVCVQAKRAERSCKLFTLAPDRDCGLESGS